MAVTSTVSEHAFAPYRGTEAQCQAYPATPGAIFFAYDTNKIYFDDKDGVRHVMSGSGIKFVYGDCSDTLVATDDSDGLLPFPRDAITSAYMLIDKPVETYQTEDIIINYDGTLYRIKKIDDEYCWVEKILVSGTGGGGGSEASTISIIYTVQFPSMIAKGQNANATIRIVDTKRGNYAELEFDFYESRNASNPYRETYAPPRVQLVNGVGTVNISIPASYLRTGLTVLKVKAYVNDRESDTDMTSFTVVDIKYEPTNQWQPSVAKRYADGASGITFPWQLTLGTGVTAQDLFSQGTIKVTATVDAANGGVSKQEQIETTSGVLELWDLFKSASHGAHTLDIVAIMTIGNTAVEISDNLHYEIGWVKDAQGIIIWSPFKRSGAMFVNYTLIEIPFVVYDPTNLVGTTTVTYYINDEEISSEDLAYTGQYNYWEIIKYNLGANTFSIVAGDAIWNAVVTITAESRYSLEPIAGSILYLSAAGRTNNERASKRILWPNEVITSNNKVLKVLDQNDEYVDSPVVLSGFNWYNNGWIKDNEGNTALRVSNGASVFIPTSLFANGGGTSPGQTYEFDFAVHNAVDYSRLINTQTKYLKYSELSTHKWFESDSRTALPYTLECYAPEEEGNNESLAVKIAEGDDPDRAIGSYMPEENELTGSESVERVVSSNSDSAFLTYYGSNRGIVLGTQEAFLSLSSSTLVSARYTDDVRVKVSFVVGPASGNNVTPMIYAYINGVLTSVLEYNASAQFAQSFENGKQGISITSDCCDVDIYGIRIYEQPLMYADIGQNWTADAPTLPLKKERYLCGKAIVKDDGSNLDYLKTKEAGLIPVMVISTVDLPTISKTQNRLPYFKGNKIGVNIRYYDPKNPKRNFHLSNSQINVQGTSSQAYPRRNFKFQVKEGSADWSDPVKMGTLEMEPNEMRLEHWDGDEANKDIYTGDYGQYITYKKNKDNRSKNKGAIDIGVGLKATAFCLKADYMDSSSVHNTAGANYATALLNNSTSYDLRHPLQRILGSANSAAYRTTVWGFPILVFWEDAEGNIDFIGRYNFNIDKASENVFGFVDDTEQPNVNGTFEEEEDDEGNPIQVKYFKAPVYDKELEDYVLQDVPCTYTNVTQCWELTNNQAGYSKFNDGRDNWLDQGTTKSGDPYYLIQDHFEQRYPEMEDEEDTREWRAKTVELGKLWDWIRQTDVTSFDYSNANRPKRTIAEPIYYKTISTEYEQAITYYSYTNGEYSPVDIHIEKTFTPDGLFTNIDIQYDENNNPMNNYYTEERLSISDNEALLKFIRVVNDGSENENNSANDKQYIGTHDFIYHDDSWYYGTEAIEDLAEIGINLTTQGSYKHFTLKFEINAVGFNVDLYEKFEYDTNRYRLCKFKAELTKHLNLNYCLFYFIYTEFFLLYDSRQKNMMISTWGPETPGGEYIWYPIFYDLDTQLGVNNSGQVYWDYDEDATPPLALRAVTRTIDGESVPDVEVYSESGSTDSIFSGNGSVLWNNMYICFKSEIMKMYNALRKADFNQEKVEYYFETNGSDKWSPVMKNYDAYYKYLAPATIGYTDQEGNIKKTSLYYYCLQGDRSLQRKTMIRNRFNYLDSAWAAGAYDPLSTKTQIKMRYNLNDRDRTSSNVYPSSATYTITPYLSQYVSVLYDETPSEVKKFKLGGNDKSVIVPPPISIQKKAELGTALTQQLAYIRGPQYLSNIGDLASKYLNELDITNAERLRELKVGDDQNGYRNIALTSVEVGAKGLLRLVDLSNLSELQADPKVNGCAKLEVLKLLGTKIGEVAMPQGSVLTTVYLPATVTMISLQRPLKLTNLLTVKPTHVNSGNDPTGLYIDNLTDKLPTFEATGTIPSSATSKIDLVQLDDTKLGYGSYRILNYLYNIKLKAQAGTLDNQTATTKELSISFMNVNWTPYQQIEPDTTYDGSQAANYYMRDYIQYQQYTYTTPSQWAKDVNNGILYRYDPNIGVSPIKNLDMFKHFYTELDDSAVRYDSYFFRPVGNTQGQKVIPTISGKLHVSNTASTKISEAQVFALYQKKNHFPDLDITADYIIPANRARFIEYLPDGTIHEFGTQKYTQSTEDPIPGLTAQVTYTFDTPTRLHYDFLGWALASGSSIDWEAQHSVYNDWMEKDVSDRTNIIINESGTAKINKLLSSYSLEGENIQYTFVAVYAVHGYTISYLMDDGTTNVCKYNRQSGQYDTPVTSIAISGQPVQFTNIIPWKDDSALSQYQTYKFVGWRLSTDDDAELYGGDSDKVLTVDRDTPVYAKFIQESVYAHPLTANDLEIQKVIGLNDAVEVTVKVDSQLRGKICIPSVVNWKAPGDSEAKDYRVIGLLANKIEGTDFVRNVQIDGTDGGNLSWQPALTHIFFAGCYSEATVPDYITEFPAYGFYGDTNLVYVDIPASLSKINGNVFQSLPKLSMTMFNDFKNVAYFEGVSLYEAWANAYNAEEYNLALHLSANIYNGYNGQTGNVKGNSFAYTPIKTIQIGTRTAPVTATTYTAIKNEAFKECYGLTEINVYAKSTVDANALKTNIAQGIDEEQRSRVEINVLPA